MVEDEQGKQRARCEEMVSVESRDGRSHGGGWAQKRAVLSPPLLRRTPADPLESGTPGTLHVGKRRAESGNH